MDAADRLFGEIAVKLGHLNREQLAECIRTQYDSPAGTSLGQIALTLGYMQPAEVDVVLMQQSRVGDRRKAKPRAGIVEIDATQGVIEERIERSDSRSGSAPPQNASRNQARNARTQPNQPPVASAYRSPSNARMPAVGARTISDTPPIDPKSNVPKATAAAPDLVRPSRRADRTLIGTSPDSGESAPAHEAITVIPPPDHQAGIPDLDSAGDPEVSFETLRSVIPKSPAPVISAAPITSRSQSTPPEANFGSFEDSEISFGTLLSVPPTPPAATPPAATPPAATPKSAAAGTIHGVGAPQPPAFPPEAPSPRPRAGTLAFAAPVVPATFEPSAAKTAPKERNQSSGTMQHFRAVTPAQPGDVISPQVSLSPVPGGQRQVQRAPRRASAWFSSLPALTPGGLTQSSGMGARASMANADLKDAAIAQLPAGTEPIFVRALRAAFDQGAHDVHFHRAAPITVRLHGSVQPLLGGTALGERAVDKALAQVMSDGQWKRLSDRGELMFAIEVPELGRARVSAYRSESGCDAVLRLFPTQARSLADLGLPSSLAKLLDYESGLIVCTGPVGSGVTTTMAALVGCVVNARQGHVVTLEEIIELRMPNTRCLVSQRQLGTHVQDMTRAMRAVAHEDADLVAVGDLRNAEEVALALSLAHGGHLVLAGGHARGAADCLNRLTRPFGKHDQGQARLMLAQSLRAVIAQHLVLRADGQGRVPAIELIVATPAVSELIRAGSPVDIASLTASGKAQKLVTLEDSLQRLVAAGTVDAAEAERVARNQPRPA